MESLHLLYPKYVLKYFALSTIFIMSPVPSNQSIILTVDNNSTNNCFFFLFQGDFPSTALKTLISVSTLVLLGLIIAYHSLEVQVTKAVFIYSGSSINNFFGFLVNQNRANYLYKIFLKTVLIKFPLYEFTC